MTSVVFLYLFALEIISTVSGDSSIEVTQIPDHVVVIRGTNVTFRCIFPFSQDGSGVDVQWDKEGESGYLDTKEDNRKLFGVKTKGSAFFQFLNVNLLDSGVYRCAVVRQESIIGTGPGSRLTVCVPPTPLKIFSRAPERSSSASFSLVCETAAFYPKDFTLTWYRNAIEIIPLLGTSVTKIVTAGQPNPEGLYKVSSSMEETQVVQIGTVYTCLISHLSLRTSAIATHTVTQTALGNGSTSVYFFISGCVGSGFTVLVLAILIGKNILNQVQKETADCADISGNVRAA